MPSQSNERNNNQSTERYFRSPGKSDGDWEYQYHVPNAMLMKALMLIISIILVLSGIYAFYFFVIHHSISDGLSFTIQNPVIFLFTIWGTTCVGAVFFYTFQTMRSHNTAIKIKREWVDLEWELYAVETKLLELIKEWKQKQLYRQDEYGTTSSEQKKPLWQQYDEILEKDTRDF